MAEAPAKQNTADAPIETGNWLLDALLKPGSSTSVQTLAFLDKVFYFLFASIFFLMWLKDFQDIHTYIFMALAVGLFFSVKFFVNELRAVQASGSLKTGDEKASAQDTDEARRIEQEEITERLQAKEQQEMLKAKLLSDPSKKTE